ncbi:hypothetical protein [Gandjariella thermophila]|uniref:Uncharacterized protein n=1 Tax=Gandjariella thermophila TaxID=1931992 RepID=A0A4D4JH71_9PSEU|nr:hypothetical protein [Gandjariella thermophila]GDY33988.1 hypothetical protein GTS_56210 [Gandjariella thermophila]
MSNGFLFWYERDWSPQLAAERIGGLEAAGLSLAHPQTGRITAISSEEDTLGEQIDVDRATLLQHAAVEADATFSFQYWIGQDIDVFCTIERLAPDRVVQRLYLDGLTVDQQRFIVGAVVDQIRASARSTCGLVIDQTGGSDSEDWDAVVAGSPGSVTVRANVVGIPNSLASKHPELHHEPSVRLGDLVVYDPDGLLPATPSA